MTSSSEGPDADPSPPSFAAAAAAEEEEADDEEDVAAVIAEEEGSLTLTWNLQYSMILARIFPETFGKGMGTPLPVSSTMFLMKSD